MYFISRCQNYD